MRVVIEHFEKSKVFEDKHNITIGRDESSDFVINNLAENIEIKFIYNEKFKNYVLINSSGSSDVLVNNRNFSKVLTPAHFFLEIKGLNGKINVEVDTEQTHHSEVKNNQTQSQNIEQNNAEGVNTMIKTMSSTNANDIFNNDVEKNRIAIIKEIGYKITELKGSIWSANITNLLLNASIFILSVVCSFGVTNFLLGLKIDNSSSVLNLTTNAGFLVAISAIVLAVSLIMKHGVYSLLDFNSSKKYGETDIAQKFITGVSAIFMFVIYIINLFYYKEIPGFFGASFFISLLFAGALATVCVASGYFKFQLKNYNQQLTNCEYREDFENVMKRYRSMINTFVNQLSQNRIATVRGSLLNNQLKMIVEVFIGLLTAPFLAYGVSNTLASCFPEAASWVRVSGLRFSPIFLVLATFLIIFAFFSFVRAFTISKQIKGSEIIKFDGFHDYNSHGVTVYGLDSMHSLGKEKNTVMFIACFIILIEFTMNVSYFITEIGGDIQGMFLSFVTALVPTALLIAETHLLSSTMCKINNYNELLSMLD